MAKNSYVILFFILLIMKFFFSISIRFFEVGQIFGGGNDSEYYDMYALGAVDEAVNLWPILLRWLNSISLYSRESISWMLSLVGFVIIPIFTSRLVISRQSYAYQDRKDYWIIMVIVSLYPSLYFQTLDIYRDVFMMAVFLLFLLCCKSLFERFSIITLCLALFLIYVLFELRGYLGASCLVALILCPLYNYRKFSLVLSFFIYFISMLILFYFGLLDPIVNDYRTIFDILEGGSNLGIRFTDTITFLPKFMQSIIYQLFGLYFPNFASLLVFLSEGILFIYILVYVIKNRSFANGFVSFLILFSIVYMTVWVLGNDNLGSATRLRMFNYICILIAFFIIKRNKRLFVSNRIQQ